MNILIMGAGAVGSVFGGFLAEAGHTVTLIGRSRHMKPIAEEGLRITGIWGDHTVRNLLAFTSLPHKTDVDIILLTVKSYQWGKVFYNVALNAPAAVLGINYGRLLESEATKELMGEIIAEAFAVAEANGNRCLERSPCPPGQTTGDRNPRQPNPDPPDPLQGRRMTFRTSLSIRLPSGMIG